MSPNGARENSSLAKASVSALNLSPPPSVALKGAYAPVRLSRARSVISTALRPLRVRPLNCVAELIKGFELADGKAPQRAVQDTSGLVVLKDEVGSMLGIRAAVSVLNRIDVRREWRTPRVPYEFFRPSSLTDKSEDRSAAVL